MVNLVDGVLGNITDTIKTMGLWDETLMVLSSDNGGPLDEDESGANNAPLRGGKYRSAPAAGGRLGSCCDRVAAPTHPARSDFEGGIRMAAFASGGYLPPAVRGTVNEGIFHIADWYATFAALAGVDPTDEKAAAAGLPPIDSVNQWPYLSGATTTAPRT